VRNAHIQVFIKKFDIMKAEVSTVTHCLILHADYKRERKLGLGLYELV